jgi:hypothetical protein
MAVNCVRQPGRIGVLGEREQAIDRVQRLHCLSQACAVDLETE